MIRQDNISRGSFVIAILITIYLATFQTTTIIIFPAILLTGGLAMEYVLERKGKGFRSQDSPDNTTDKKELTGTAYYAVIGFVGILITGYAINFANFIATMAVTSFDAVLFSSLMAISEEMFFRGFILDLLLVSIKVPYVALFVSAGIFAAYHLARYGTQIDSLIYVFAGGFILSWVTWKSRRLGPAIIGHTLNNVLSALQVI